MVAVHVIVIPPVGVDDHLRNARLELEDLGQLRRVEVPEGSELLLLELDQVALARLRERHIHRPHHSHYRNDRSKNPR